jgi:hypothetical protein
MPAAFPARAGKREGIAFGHRGIAMFITHNNAGVNRFCDFLSRGDKFFPPGRSRPPPPGARGRTFHEINKDISGNAWRANCFEYKIVLS